MENQKYALIVSGDALIHALKPAISLKVSLKINKIIKNNNSKKTNFKLMEIASFCEAVLCCRVSPKQKQEVVSLVRQQVEILT